MTNKKGQLRPLLGPSGVAPIRSPTSTHHGSSDYRHEEIMTSVAQAFKTKQPSLAPHTQPIVNNVCRNKVRTVLALALLGRPAGGQGPIPSSPASGPHLSPSPAATTGVRRQVKPVRCRWRRSTHVFGREEDGTG
jgi:hypothetical protein